MSGLLETRKQVKQAKNDVEVKHDEYMMKRCLQK